MLVTHSAGVAAGAGRVVRMRDGRIVERERADGVLAALDPAGAVAVNIPMLYVPPVATAVLVLAAPAVLLIAAPLGVRPAHLVALLQVSSLPRAE